MIQGKRRRGSLSRGLFFFFPRNPHTEGDTPPRPRDALRALRASVVIFVSSSLRSPSQFFPAVFRPSEVERSSERARAPRALRFEELELLGVGAEAVERDAQPA